MPVRSKAEAEGSGEVSPLWSGQAVALGRPKPAGELTSRLAAEALKRLRHLSSVGFEELTVDDNSAALG